MCAEGAKNAGRLLKIPFRYQRYAKDVLDSLWLQNHALRKIVDTADVFLCGVQAVRDPADNKPTNVEGLGKNHASAGMR
jgi:hypothetical protein